jgi:hypothetical protein
LKYVEYGGWEAFPGGKSKVISWLVNWLPYYLQVTV